MTSQTLTGHKVSNSTTTDQTNSTGFLMLKRLSLLVGLLFCAPAFAAGTVPGFSLTPQFDSLGRVAPGCKLYVIQAGTTSTPQNAYQDSALTTPHPNPMTCDSTGRLPQWFVADGQIKLRLTDRNGTGIFTQDNLLVIGPSSGGGGGGGTIDPTTVLSTGDVKTAYGTNILTGFVRANGRTIGSATSGATERANADTQALFIYLWDTDSNLSVSGGRGASGDVDFAAGKTIALPDFRGRVLAGFDDMGNVAAGRLTTAGGMSGIGIGAVGGAQTRTIAQANLPAVTLTTTITDPGHTHSGSTFVSQSNIFLAAGGNPVPTIVNTGSITSATTGITASTALGGSGTALLTVQPTIFVTTYLKL